MASTYLSLVLITITYLAFGTRSIKFHVNSELHHHLRHHNGHQDASGHRTSDPLTSGGGNKPPPNFWTMFEKSARNNAKNDLLFSRNASETIGGPIRQGKWLSTPRVTDDDDDETLDQFGEKQREVDDRSKATKIKCPKCSGTTNVRVSEEELIELRIEFVKNQILQKLRLKERPQVTIGDLPRPIYEGATIHGDEKFHTRDLDDYYARTSQKFIFLEQERTECDRINESPSICFSFKIDGDIDSIDVSTAELWVYKQSSSGDSKRKETLVVSELDQGGITDNREKYLPKAKPIAIQTVGAEASWIRIDIAWPIKKWFLNHELNHIIRITCQSCEMDMQENLLSTQKDHRPFILIDTVNRRKVRRPKRSVNCAVGVSECCREKFYISFEEIGWNDWILHPPGYDAYFCRGSCSTAASITMSNSHYSTVLRKVIYQRESSGGKALELIPCCTAKQFSSLQLVYLDSNNTGTVKTLPNMVVESCGCM